MVLGCGWTIPTVSGRTRHAVAAGTASGKTAAARLRKEGNRARVAVASSRKPARPRRFFREDSAARLLRAAFVCTARSRDYVEEGGA